MNLQDTKYNQFFLIREMLETGEIVKRLDIKKILSYEKEVKKERIFFTGEGSSRIFPAKKIMYEAQKKVIKKIFIPIVPLKHLNIIFWIVQYL